MPVCRRCHIRESVERCYVCSECITPEQEKRRQFRIRRAKAGECQQHKGMVVLPGKLQCRKCQNQSFSESKRVRNYAKYKQRIKELREIALEKYGSRCQCCDYPIKEFLVFDHIHNDGWKMRSEHGHTNTKFYHWLLQEDRSDIIQVLCNNCNMSKAFNGGECFHRTIDYRIFQWEAGCR